MLFVDEASKKQRSYEYTFPTGTAVDASFLPKYTMANDVVKVEVTLDTLGEIE